MENPYTLPVDRIVANLAAEYIMGWSRPPERDYWTVRDPFTEEQVLWDPVNNADHYLIVTSHLGLAVSRDIARATGSGRLRVILLDFVDEAMVGAE